MKKLIAIVLSAAVGYWLFQAGISFERNRIAAAMAFSGLHFCQIVPRSPGSTL